MEEKIQKATVRDFLISEFNRHIGMYVGNLIEMTFVMGRDPNEIVITLISKSPDPQFAGVERNIKAKDAQVNAKKEMDKQESILRAIERLIQAEDKKETKFID